MPSAVLPQGATPATSWKRPQKTSHDLPWADIKVIDLSKYDAPGGKKELAEELREAVCPLPSGLSQAHLVHGIPNF